MKDSAGCYFVLLVFLGIIIIYNINRYFYEIIWFGIFGMGIYVSLIFLIFFFDYLYTLYITNFSDKIKEIIIYEIEIDKIKIELESSKHSILKNYKGDIYYNFLEKNNTFKI